MPDVKSYELVEAILESMAVNGLKALKRALDSRIMARGGDKAQVLLKDYELNAEMEKDGVVFTITFDFEHLDDYSKRVVLESASAYKKARSAAQSRDGARKVVKRYTMRSDGRPERIAGRFDARKPSRDARTIRPEIRKTSEQRQRRDALKVSADRSIEHENITVSPRGMDIEDGKIYIEMQRTVKTVNDKTIMPKRDYQGLLGTAVEDFLRIAGEAFVEALK